LNANDITLKVVELSKTYKLGNIEVPAVCGVSCEVKRGEFVAITGPSGCGKSTFMHLIGCLDKPTTGQIYLDGDNVADFDDNQLAAIRNKKIGFVFQSFNLLPKMNAEKNVSLPLYYADVRADERDRRAHSMLDQMGLEKRAHHKPAEMSGGERQRIAIARALINNPAIMLADEPTGNLDSKTSVDIMRIFQDINKKGATIVVVTHEPDIVRYTKRVIKLRDGIIIGDEKVEQVII
jgi:putative ABC transport system ATP-binding protein